MSAASPTRAPRRIELIARGILIRDGRLLLCSPADGGYAYLPGGHVEPGESAGTALAREFDEELGWRVDVGAFVMALDSTFLQGGKPRHEINLTFHVEHPPADPVSREADIRFFWHPVERLNEVAMLPAAMAAWFGKDAASRPLYVFDGDAAIGPAVGA